MLYIPCHCRLGKFRHESHRQLESDVSAVDEKPQTMPTDLLRRTRKQHGLRTHPNRQIPQPIGGPRENRMRSSGAPVVPSNRHRPWQPRTEDARVLDDGPVFSAYARQDRQEYTCVE